MKPHDSSLDHFRALYAKYETPASLAITLSILAGHYVLRIPFLERFVTLSHQVPGTSLYVRGTNDPYFVVFWIVAITCLRALCIQYVLHPIARAHKVQDENKVVRFGEQGWAVLYPAFFWSMGAYIMWNSPYRYDLKYMFVDFPHTQISALFKWYYLVQLAFWFQQVLILHAEKPRKDYHVMVAHHAMTILLMGFSYTHDCVRAGNAVLVCMDLADILLPLAKVMGYLAYQKAADVVFAVFFVGWIITRHFGLCSIIYAIWIHVPGLGLLNDDNISFYMWCGFLTLLCGLEVLCIWWFGLILKVLYKVVFGKGAEDVRSDDEDDEDDKKQD